MEHQTNSKSIAMKELARAAISWLLGPGIGRRREGTSHVRRVCDAKCPGSFSPGRRKGFRTIGPVLHPGGYADLDVKSASGPANGRALCDSAYPLGTVVS
jgi:hypothetical protein